MDKFITIPILLSTFFIVTATYVVLSNKINDWVKVFYIIFASAIGFVVWNAIPSHMGYATIERLPDKWVLVWGAVDEQGGKIEILVEPYDPAKEKKGFLFYKTDFIEKRLYRCKYEKNLGDGIEQNLEKAAKGIKVVFSRKGEGEPNTKDKGPGNGQQGEFVFHESLPPGRMPDK
jgi:hypothetical protein